MTERPGSVAVVGAGIAGLGAANTLRQHGVEVRLLEARSRPGGRIWTSRQWSEALVDLGASWIHGLMDNPVTDLADRFGLDTAITEYDHVVTYDTDGSVLSAEGETFMEEALELLRGILAEDGRTLCKAPGPHGSIFDAFNERVRIDALPEHQRHWLFAAFADLEHEYGADLETLDRCTGFAASGDDSYGADVWFPGGYDRVVEAMTRGLHITYDCEVRLIEHGPRGVRLRTSRGTVEADRAVVTLPLGVLQADAVTFEPELPEPKRRAISALGSGLLNKCALRFPEVFWDPEPDFLGHVDPERGRFSEFMNLYPRTRAPVLVAFHGGSVAAHLESLTDRATAEDAMEILRGIYGRDIPSPTGIQVSRWAADPWARGAYSFHAVGSGPEDRLKLAEPVEDRLFFAGEATADCSFQSVAGALLSGYREAERLLGKRPPG